MCVGRVFIQMDGDFYFSMFYALPEENPVPPSSGYIRHRCFRTVSSKTLFHVLDQPQTDSGEREDQGVPVQP